MARYTQAQSSNEWVRERNLRLGLCVVVAAQKQMAPCAEAAGHTPSSQDGIMRSFYELIERAPQSTGNDNCIDSDRNQYHSSLSIVFTELRGVTGTY